MLRKRNNLKGSNGKKDDVAEYTCTIRFLDDAEPMHVSFQRETKGQWLLDYVCRELNLVEKDYFGLRYVDADKQRIGDSKHLGMKEHWLDQAKPVYKQMKNVNPLVLCFRVKFYPPDPTVLKEEITRYFLFLQLRRDLHHGRLLCTQPDACALAAYIVQSEVGDYDPVDHVQGYVNSFNMLPKQTPKIEEKISEIHKTLTGQVPSEAESNFLKKAASLETYGVDPYQVKDQKGNQLYLGVTHLGIVTFLGSKRSHLFKWPQINRIAFEGKMFIVHITVQEKKHAHGFKCQSYSACRQLWRVAVEQQSFFTLTKSTDASKMASGGGLFQRSSKFRFSGRCHKEVIVDSRNITREPPHFVRSPSNSKYVNRSNTLPARINRELSDSGYGTMTRKQDNIALADARDSVLMDFDIPEDNAAAVSVPPLPVTAVVEPPVYSAEVSTDYSAPPAPIAESDETMDDLDEPIEYMKLDAEIECLQIELNRMNREPSSELEQDFVSEKANGACHSELEPPQPLVVKKSFSPIRALMISVGVVLFGLLICILLMVAFMEVKWDQISVYQNHHHVKEFRVQYYDPVRAYVADGWAKLLPK